MPLMLSKLYDALLEAGASDVKAREAAEELAAYENRFQRIETDLSVLKWMACFNLIVTLGVLWRVFTKL
jgi:hypothetical protein